MTTMFLMRRDLKHGGYTVPTKADRADLIDHCKRLWRDLPDYTQCTSNQLRKFNLDRRLISRTEYHDNRLHTKQLIRNLKAADENLTFRKFLDLPPELRCRIYDCYTKEFPANLRRPTQSPLARIHPVIPTELLPIFYRSATFNLELLTAQKNITSRPKRLHFDKASYAWPSNLSDTSLAEIQDWELRIGSWQWGFVFHFDGIAAETRVIPVRYQENSSEEKDIMKAIKEVLNEAAQREGKLKLKRQDLSSHLSLRDAIQARISSKQAHV
ncbi:hypothetical protein AC578_3960 [Pseudocercospora eumusae]|uniref:Uncharacterized protein n=1 Tax=Pseudocercospora eumusae TaxID=321146 RepID=A0A139HLS7_9PEZI|nr:hypothetical protein AC578_3960 [Pseudocercospora eumusae]